jgi:predicted transcriptional regulator
MDIYIKPLIKDFKGKNFKDFALFVNAKMKKEIDSRKKKQDKDKYIKIRQNVLNYIIANERAISIELNKKNK